MRNILFVALVGAALSAGCRTADRQSNLPPGENGSRAGGAGSFGEDPQRPGVVRARSTADDRRPDDAVGHALSPGRTIP